jgi:hypothetical protein
VIGGIEGIGKDALLAPVLDAVGRDNVRVVHGSSLLSEFNGYLARSKVLVINEIDFGDHRDRRGVSETLKPMLARPPDKLVVNEKNLRPYEVPNLVQMFGFTNHRVCMHVSSGERRLLMLWAGVVIPDEDRPRWEEWLTQYWDWLQTGGSSRVLTYLRARDIRAFRPGARPPVTGWLEDLQGTSRDGLESWLLEQIARGDGIFGERILRVPDVLHLLGTIGGGGAWFSGRVTPGRLTRALAAIGAKSRRLGDARNRGWEITQGNGIPGVEDDGTARKAGALLRAAQMWGL